MARTGAQRMAELLRCTVELPIPTKMLQVPAMDLVRCTAPMISEGSYDVGTTGSSHGTLLAEAENTPRLAGETICRHACQRNPREEPYALTRPYGSERGARGNSGPYRDPKTHGCDLRICVSWQLGPE